MRINFQPRQELNPRHQYDRETSALTNLLRQINIYSSIQNLWSCKVCENHIISKVENNSFYLSRAEDNLIVNCTNSSKVRSRMSEKWVKNKLRAYSTGTHLAQSMICMHKSYLITSYAEVLFSKIILLHQKLPEIKKTF